MLVSWHLTVKGMENSSSDSTIRKCATTWNFISLTIHSGFTIYLTFDAEILKPPCTGVEIPHFPGR